MRACQRSAGAEGRSTMSISPVSRIERTPLSLRSTLSAWNSGSAASRRSRSDCKRRSSSGTRGATGACCARPCFLGYADHRVPSVLYRWSGKAFEHFQTLDGDSGRAFSFFEANREGYLAFANLIADTILYRWDGDRFVKHQTLSGPEGREFAHHEENGEHYLVQVNLLLGTREKPQPVMDS